jgi:molybdate transport system regulatory protein
MADPAALSATIMLQKSPAGRVGAERIALLRAISETGSISGAARQVGLSYKSAWGAVQVLNNLFDRPLVLASPGGRDGGVTDVTDAGMAVITAFEAAEAELAGAFARLEAGLSAAQAASLKPLLWGIAMKTSARNALRGTVKSVKLDAVSAEVILTIADGVEIVSTITAESAADLGLTPGVTALALIKSSFVILARGDETLRTSARNCLAGKVLHREDGPINSEITLELTLGKTLTAVITRESADVLELEPGTPALALVKASHVILAIE